MNNNELTNFKTDDRRFIRASQLSLSDDFLKYIPKTPAEEALKEEIKRVIQTGVLDFWHSGIETFVDKKKCICFLAVVIKEMVSSGTPIDYAWEIMCNDPCSSNGSLRDYLR